MRPHHISLLEIDPVLVLKVLDHNLQLLNPCNILLLQIFLSLLLVFLVLSLRVELRLVQLVPSEHQNALDVVGAAVFKENFAFDQGPRIPGQRDSQPEVLEHPNDRNFRGTLLRQQALVVLQGEIRGFVGEEDLHDLFVAVQRGQMQRRVEVLV